MQDKSVHGNPLLPPRAQAAPNMLLGFFLATGAALPSHSRSNTSGTWLGRVVWLVDTSLTMMLWPHRPRVLESPICLLASLILRPWCFQRPQQSLL